jgi:hypothetical protein
MSSQPAELRSSLSKVRSKQPVCQTRTVDCLLTPEFLSISAIALGVFLSEHFAGSREPYTFCRV